MTCELNNFLRRLLFVGAVTTGMAIGQFSYFGKNKVQLRDYQFQSFETEHFKILFYPGGEVLAEFAAKAAEKFYSALSKDLNMELEEKVPLIVYLSPGQFSETNVITDLIDEGVGGFSELIKNRIVLPFNGSYRDFYHIIGHELAHIFEFQMFYRSRLALLLGAVGEFQVPLWIMEGFAEFQSGWVNVHSDIFMRDLVINNRLVSLVDLNDNYGYLAYREGESFFHYVAEHYGREKVYEFMNTLKSKRSLDGTFRAVFGMSQERVGEDWERWLRMRYWPQIVKIKNFIHIAEKLTDHRKDGSVYNTAPAISPSGTKIALISDRAEYVDLYIISALNGEVLKRLVRGGRSGGFEGLHLLRPGVSWSPDETMIALVVTSRGRDNISIIDVRNGKVRKRIFANLDAIYTPRFSPDGKHLVFVGIKNGFSDIWVADITSGEVKRITYDIYEDRDPAFSPSGDTIVFVSDRPDINQKWNTGDYAIWLRYGKGDLKRISERSSFFSSPIFAHSGEFIFWSAADSSGQNICIYSLKDEKVIRRSDFLGEVSHLSLSRDDRKLVFAYFENVGWDVALLLDPLEKIPIDTAPRSGLADSITFTRDGLDFDRVQQVGFSLSLDYIAGAASYTSGAQGFAGTADVAFSDILGNHRFEIYTDLYGDILNSNLVIQYWLLPFRIDYGFTLFQWRDFPYYYPGVVLKDRIARGGSVTISYPFNRFMRFETGLTGLGNEINSWRFVPEQGWYLDTAYMERIFYGSGAWVFDNTYWPDEFGPVRGTRTRLEAGSSFLSSRQFEAIQYDFRNYQRLGRRFVFASLLLSGFSFGQGQQYYIGGEYVRGYNWGEFYQKPGWGIGLFKLELRYPFIDRLKIAFPLPIDIRGVRGVAFFDGGLVIRDSMRLWNGREFDDLKLGAGLGLRIPIYFFYLKFDFARPLSTTEDKGWKFDFSLGYDF